MAGYLKIDGIEGECTEPDHTGWINIECVSQDLHRPTMQGKGASTRHRSSVTCGDVVVVKEMDSSTPKLIQAICDGKNFKEVKIDLCTSVGGTKRLPYYQVVINDVMISNYSVSGTCGKDGGVPTESLSLNYLKISWVYDKMGKDSKSKGKVDATWQVEEGIA
jgi:type VI secretion system secreted protein Hcp